MESAKGTAGSGEPKSRRERIHTPAPFQDLLRCAWDALPLAGALMEGGLPCAEVTFRTPAAVEALGEEALL